MEIEILKAMSEGIYLSLLMKIVEAIVLITVFFAITGLATYLAGLAWFCFEETRRAATTPQRAWREPSPVAWNSGPRRLSLQPQPSLTEIRRNE
jgi:hypothetical protein